MRKPRSGPPVSKAVVEPAPPADKCLYISRRPGTSFDVVFGRHRARITLLEGGHQGTLVRILAPPTVQVIRDNVHTLRPNGRHN